MSHLDLLLNVFQIFPIDRYCYSVLPFFPLHFVNWNIDIYSRHDSISKIFVDNCLYAHPMMLHQLYQPIDKGVLQINVSNHMKKGHVALLPAAELGQSTLEELFESPQGPLHIFRERSVLTWPPLILLIAPDNTLILKNLNDFKAKILLDS